MGFKDITQLAMASCNVSCASQFIYLDGRHNNQFLKVSIMNLSHFREVGIARSFMKKPVLHNVLWVVLERRSKEIKLRNTHTISRYLKKKNFHRRRLSDGFLCRFSDAFSGSPSLFWRLVWIAVAYPTVVGVAYPTAYVDIRRLSDGYEGYFKKKISYRQKYSIA